MPKIISEIALINGRYRYISGPKRGRFAPNPQKKLKTNQKLSIDTSKIALINGRYRYISGPKKGRFAPKPKTQIEKRKPNRRISKRVEQKEREHKEREQKEREHKEQEDQGEHKEREHKEREVKEYERMIDLMQIRNIYNDVTSFIRDDARKSIIFKNLRDRDYRDILVSIRIPDDYKYRLYLSLPGLVLDGKEVSAIPLNPTNLANLIEELDEMKTREEYEEDQKYRIRSSSDRPEISWSDREILDTLITLTEVELYKEPKKAKPKRGGAFFPYLNTTDISLEKYGIFKEIDKGNYSENCLIWAIKQSKKVDDVTINNIKHYVRDRHYPLSKLGELAKLINCNIELKTDTNKTKITRYLVDGETKITPTIHLGVIKEHYFLNDETIYNCYAIKHYEEVKHKKNWEQLKSKDYRSSSPISAFRLITLLLEGGHMTPITLSTENILSTQYYTEVENLEGLDYPDTCIKPVKEENKVQIESNPDTCERRIYYIDFETYLDSTGKHQAYLCCSINNDGLERAFVGKTCGKQLLDFISKNIRQIGADKDGNPKYEVPLIYAHNMGYDSSFLIEYLNVSNIIDKGKSVKCMTATYFGKLLEFKDSFAVIPEGLAKFKKMFGLNIKKEYMPYELYTEENIASGLIDLKLVNLKKMEIDVNNYIVGDRFDIIRYAEFYCRQDCRVLKQGFTKFRKWMYDFTKLDAVNFISLPGLAHQYFINQGCYDEVYQLSGIPRMFIQQCVKGGRCMTNDNHKWKVTGRINDFDAVSLYPSAMARLGFLKGRPKVIPNDKLNMEFLNSVDGYFIEIKNVTVGKRLKFPLQSELEEGIRNYTNDFKGSLYVDKISLEDFIKYQQATFEIVRGYYFNEGRNMTIQPVITQCFNERKLKKSQDNPIEVVYKLLMNSSYGKTIMKEIKVNTVFKTGKEENERFRDSNYNYIKSFIQLSGDKCVYKIQKSIEQHFNIAHVGSEILAMSKRIMNEVMCLAEDLELSIYYQDTDSMHILDEEIQILADNFNRIYGRDLIGEDMGQFHSDFSVKDKRDPEGEKKIKNIYATQSYFLGKKAYIDVLTTDNVEDRKHMKTNYHIRMKGVPGSCITKMFENPVEAYEKMFEGEAITFDLLKSDKVIFVKNRDFSYSKCTDFKRKVQF
jgi:hypothetical protein